MNRHHASNGRSGHFPSVGKTFTHNHIVGVNKMVRGGMLSEDSVVKESLITALDRKNYRANFYNLDATTGKAAAETFEA